MEASQGVVADVLAVLEVAADPLLGASEAFAREQLAFVEVRLVWVAGMEVSGVGSPAFLPVSDDVLSLIGMTRYPYRPPPAGACEGAAAAPFVCCCCHGVFVVDFGCPHVLYVLVESDLAFGAMPLFLNHLRAWFARWVLRPFVVAGLCLDVDQFRF